MDRYVTVGVRFEDGSIVASRQPTECLSSLIHDCRLLCGERERIDEWLVKGEPAQLVPDASGIVVVDYLWHRILSVQNHQVFGQVSLADARAELKELAATVDDAPYGFEGGVLACEVARWRALLDEERVSLELVDYRTERVLQSRSLGVPSPAELHAEVERLWIAHEAENPAFWRLAVSLLPMRSTDFRCRNQSGLAAMFEQMRATGFRLDAPQTYRWREAIKGEVALTGWTC
jgi:hypothetical protein